MQIKDNTFLVTGGPAGWAKLAHGGLAAADGRVVIADLNENAGETLAKQLGGTARFIRTDVTNASEAQAAIDFAKREFGSLQGLIQCAGIWVAARIFGKEGRTIWRFSNASSG